MTRHKTVDNCFCRRKSPKQEVGRAECIEAIGDDYATGLGNEKSHLRNQRNSEHHLVYRVFSFLVAVVALCFMTFEVMSSRSHSDQRANNLQPKEKRLIIVFPTVDTAEQGVREASVPSDNERLCERCGRS